MKQKGVVDSKEQFYYNMDMLDLETAGAFVEKEIWDKFIIKPDGKIRITPTDYTRKNK